MVGIFTWLLQYFPKNNKKKLSKFVSGYLKTKKKEVPLAIKPEGGGLNGPAKNGNKMVKKKYQKKLNIPALCQWAEWIKRMRSKIWEDSDFFVIKIMIFCI